MNILEVKNLKKSYPTFSLDVSFSLKPGQIMGYIGRNGAGKTTTFRCMTGYVHPDSGQVEMFGLPFNEHELECKERLGIVMGPFRYYHRLRLKDITSVTKKFYRHWDNEEYQKCLSVFQLDERKTPDMLSEGMRVKYSLALALSHQAECLILDEPTSGLDPVSRDELLDIFKNLVSTGKRSILFSTHITSDLDKCCDAITYIKQGQIVASMPKTDFINRYCLITGKATSFGEEDKKLAIGSKIEKDDFSALILATDKSKFSDVKIFPCDLETIMVYTERGNNNEKIAL